MTGASDDSPLMTVAGVAATAVGGAVALYRGAEQLPLVGDLLRRGRTDLAARGERALDPVKELIAAVATQIVELVLDELDLNELVRQRVDLIGLTNEVIDGIDLQSVIRQSTDKLADEVVSDVLHEGEQVEHAVTGFVGHLLHRDQK